MNKSDLSVETDANASETEPGGIEISKLAKKSFVVPEISVPVDVLEATTFFQLVDSGVTNP